MIIGPTPVVARPDQFGRSRGETHALAFLARYRVPQTRAAYAISRRQWFGWCAERGIDPLNALGTTSVLVNAESG